MTYTTDPPHADRRARPTQSTENGDTCDSCGRRFNVVYRVANTVWPQIAPHPETLGDYPEHQFGGILCPDCATEIAETKGIKLRFCAEHGWPRDNASAALDRAEKAEAQLATARAEGKAEAQDYLMAEAVRAFDNGRHAERERIAIALDSEADVIPCEEDASVVRSCAKLVRADFSYEDAEGQP